MQSTPTTTLPPLGRRIRLGAALTAIVLTLCGSVFWDDDAFPFGPFRMFSTRTPPNGNVSVFALEARFPDGSWRRVPLESSNVGVTRADVEGQDKRLKAEPRLLQHMADAHTRLRPGEPRWTGVRVIQDLLMLRHREYVGTKHIVIAEWSRP